MRSWIFVFVLVYLVTFFRASAQNGLSTWRGGWQISPTTASAWSVQTRIPRTFTKDIKSLIYDEEEEDDDEENDKDQKEEDDRLGRKGFGKKKKKKYKKFLLPLLVAYKLKFFTLIPVLIGGLVLLTGATGLAGFFFALFAATMGLKSGHHHH